MKRTQYYSITFISDEKNAKGVSTGKKIRLNATKDVIGTVSYTETDGLPKEVTFVLKDGMKYEQSFGIGNFIELVGGTLDNYRLLFIGYVKKVAPKYQESGELHLTYTCLEKAYSDSGLAANNFLYPSKNCKRAWANKNSLTLKELIEGIAKDNEFTIGTLDLDKVGNSTVFTHITPIKQHNKSDYAFLNELATKYGFVFWEEVTSNGLIVNFVLEKILTTRIGKTVFFNPARIGSNFVVNNIDEDYLQFITPPEINLDTDHSKGGLKMVTDANGNEQLVSEEYNDKTNEWEYWVFQSEILDKEPQEVKDQLMNAFESRKLGWDMIQKYFKKVTREAVSTRDVEASSITIPGTAYTTTPSDSKKTYRMNTEKLNSKSPEEKADIMSRAIRFKLTDKEFNEFFTATESDLVTDNKSNEDKAINTDTTNSKKRRDEGFHIVGEVYLNPDIRTKMSYIVRGIGIYTAKYYLYTINHNFGDSPSTKITFTK